VLGPEALRLVIERGVADDHLRDAVAVTEIEEQHAAEVADAMHPAEQDDVAADVGCSQRSKGVGARQLSERFYCHCASDVRCPMADGRWPVSDIRCATVVATVPRPTVSCCPVARSFILTSP